MAARRHLKAMSKVDRLINLDRLIGLARVVIVKCLAQLRDRRFFDA